MTRTITREELRRALDGGALTVVDALPTAPYANRHLPGALNLTIEEIANAGEVLPDRTAAIVTYSTDLDFMVRDPRLEGDTAGKFGSVADTTVVGRQTFLDMEAYWTTADGDLAAWLNTTRKVVLSTNGSYDVGAWENSTLAAGDGAEQVRCLKASTGGALVAFGGV